MLFSSKRIWKLNLLVHQLRINIENVFRCSIGLSNVLGDYFLNNLKMKLIGFENFVHKSLKSKIKIG